MLMTEINLTKNALRVLQARYLRRDATGQIVETPAQLFESVSHGVADAELILGNALRSTPKAFISPSSAGR